MFSSNFTLAILGGGQLGKMLLSQTNKWDIRTKVLDPSADAPCSISCNEFFVGDLNDYDTVYNFGKGADVLTVEIENVNIEALYALESEGVKVYPTARSLEIIQNKASQKQFYKENGIPTSNFRIFSKVWEIEDALTMLFTTLEMPFVWKSARFGYDGNGVKVIRRLSDLAGIANIECVVEDFVPFDKELSVIVARSVSGQVKTYPVVEMEFHPEANQVEYVLCPARIDDTISQKARSLAQDVAQKLGIVGLLAVEMFLTKDDELLVNEVAPRPHNSGHFSIEASYTSQFEQHLRAILNLPLGSTCSKIPSVIVNLVGEEGFSGDVLYQNIEEVLSLEGVTPHIYGKKQTRPFRKMGHITIVNPSLEVARDIAQRVKKTIRIISK